MKQYSKKLFSLAVLCIGMAAVTLQANGDDNDNDNNSFRIAPFLQWRSQGRDEARKLYGTTSYAVYQDIDVVDEGDGGCWRWGLGYGTFNVTVQYDQSFRGKQIARALFGPALINDFNVENNNNNNNCDNDCNEETIVISGLNVEDRGMFDLMAENFLLPHDFRSTISFRPKVQDVVVDFNLFVGLDKWCSGLYFRLYGPVVWNRATLKPRERIIDPGTEENGNYAPGYFDPLAEVPVESMFTNALSFFGGCEFPNDYPLLPGFEDGQPVVVQPLRFAKFSDCNLNPNPNNCDDDCNSFRRHKTGFAELRGEFGYNYIQENYRLLLNVQAAAPTGTKVKAKYLFPAQVGNGHHWELGVGVGGAWRMWCNEDMERSFNFIVEADITHLFRAKQERTFDLKCKPLSRYMLAEKLLPNEDLADNSRLVDPSDAGFQFGVADPDADPAVAPGEYAPVANFSTRKVKVSIGVQGDLVAMFNYTCRGFSWDLGYNFWAMSTSKISLPCEDECNDPCGIQPFPKDTWALKGDASVAGYNPASTDAPTFVVGLAATEGGTDTTLGATIFTGTNAALDEPLSNPGIDNPVPAVFNPTGAAGAEEDLFVFNTDVQINTSVPPVFISIDDLDIEGARQRGLSHKVFTHLSYTWTECSDRWMPYVGAGVSAEFGSHTGNDCNPTPVTLENCNNDCSSRSLSFALSKWAVEVKGGVSFH